MLSDLPPFQLRLFVMLSASAAEELAGSLPVYLPGTNLKSDRMRLGSDQSTGQDGKYGYVMYDRLETHPY